MRKTILMIGLALGTIAPNGSALAETRNFTDQKGRKMAAELVSHKGDGTIELRREDGKTFSVKPTVFSIEDQSYIKKWIEKNPPKINYHFDVKYEVEKLSGTRRDFGYKKVKNEELAYQVELRNLARNSVGNLKFEYRIFAKNEADGSFSSNDRGGFYKGSGVIKGPLRYNESETITTLGVQIDFVDYDGAGYRYKDGLLGFMLRIKDAQGNIALDYVSPTNTMKGHTWDAVNPKHEIRKRRNDD